MKDDDSQFFLVVDDNQLTLLALSEFLRRRGFHILPASSGQQARQILKKQKTLSAAILDVDLPDANGLDLYRELKELFPDLPIRLVSGYEPEAINGLSGIPEAILFTKPFSMEDLVNSLFPKTQKNK